MMRQPPRLLLVMRQPPRLLLVMQTPDASTGRCGRKLRERGYALDCCYPLAGQPLPPGWTVTLGLSLRRQRLWSAVPPRSESENSRNVADGQARGN
jgi:hypothetical protein